MKNDTHDSVLLMVPVGPAEVSQMLALYDTGMADRTTCNAVALAFREIFKPGLRSRVRFLTRNERCALHLGDEAITLPSHLDAWLRAAERHVSVEPISVPAILPLDWLAVPRMLPCESSVQPKEAMVA